MAERAALGASKRWVVKIGSSMITAAGRGLDVAAMNHWASQMASLRAQGKELVLVSSGAVAEGMARLGWRKRPHELHKLQAAAALGQMGLIQQFESCFKQHGILTAQVLLTHDDLSHRGRYLNARSTLRTLLDLGVLPIINENDTVAIEEIRLGDNDTLAALVTNLVEADVNILLTDQAGLYDKNPREHANATLIQQAEACDSRLLAMAGEGGALGRGGMRTKVLAAQRAARSGASTIIAAGDDTDVLLKIARGDVVGTLLTPSAGPITARKQWLANQLKISGGLRLDAGASNALLRSGVSLLAVGVREVQGEFKRGELVSCIADDGREIARGLVNYSADEARKIMGLASDRIETVLGYIDEPELINRDNLVLV
jgi:glutamate 5-kinase